MLLFHVMAPSPPRIDRRIAPWLALVALASSAGADEPMRRLDDVRCPGLATLTCETVTHHLGLAAGTELSPPELDRALRRLWRTGLVDDLALELEPTRPGRARLVVTITERPLLDAVTFAGLDRLTRTWIERWLANRSARPQVGSPVDRPALERLRAELATHLADALRPARVSYDLRPSTPGQVVAVYRIQTLPRGPVLAEIRFAGAAAFEPARLRRVLERNKQASAANRLAGGGRLDEPGLASDCRALERHYRAHGFKDVEIGPPRTEPTDRAGAVRLILPVREGRRWKLGTLSVSGNRVVSDQRLLGLYSRHGDRLDLPALENWHEAIRRLYLGLGRPDTTVRQRLRERPGGRVDVTVTVREGPPLRLGRLTVTGNTRTFGAVVRSELGVDEGQLLDLIAVERGLARLRARGLFEPAPDALALARRGDGSNRVDLVVSGREADPFRIDVGGGWSNSDGLSAHLRLEARNLLGRGVAAGLRTSEGNVRDRLELYALDPMFLGRRQTLGGELFDRGRRLTPALDQVLERRERGWRIGWSRPLARRQGLRLDLMRARIADSQSRSDEGTTPFAARFERSTAAFEWVRDRRDDPLRPRRGERLRLALAASVDHGAGGRELLQPQGELSLFRPLGGGAVGALRVSGGTFETSGEAVASPLDAFFLGGPSSVRGFATGSIAARGEDGEPLVDSAGFWVGGDRFLEAALEVRFPLVGPLAGAVFLDSGQVWAKGQSLVMDRPRTAAGVEIWLQPRWLPHPLRVTWAHNLDPLPADEFDRFLIGFGAGF